MQHSAWKEYRYRLEGVLCAGCAWGIPRLPRRLCLALAHGLGTLAYYLDGASRRVALANLACVFPERSEQERREIARRSFQNFARTMLDLFWAPSLTPENWRRYIEMEGAVEAFQQAGEKSGRVVLCAHWGNFEWVNHAVAFLGAHMTVLAGNFKNTRLSAIFNGARESSGNTVIAQENSMIRLLKVIKRRGTTGMLVDLTLRPDQAALPINAFGRKMCVTFLHAILTQRGGALLFPFDNEPLPDGRCRMTISPALALPPDATLQEIAQACWDHFEPHIRRRPELYMWSYKHLRYRPSDAAPEDYPFYASVSQKFERLLASNAPRFQKNSPGDLTNTPTSSRLLS